jgi:hypothetical protein
MMKKVTIKPENKKLKNYKVPLTARTVPSSSTRADCCHFTFRCFFYAFLFKGG